MTIEIEGLSDAIVAAEIAAWIGGTAFMLMAAFFLYLLVRPVRRKRPPTEADADMLDPAEMRDLIERIEGRLEVLERVVATERRRPGRLEEQEFENAGGAPETRRMK